MKVSKGWKYQWFDFPTPGKVGCMKDRKIILLSAGIALAVGLASYGETVVLDAALRTRSARESAPPVRPGVPGFEANKCLIQKTDQIDLPLRWGDKSACELAGQTISLRFYLRSANIYAVTSGQPKIGN